jgi:hypothetical protein
MTQLATVDMDHHSVIVIKGWHHILLIATLLVSVVISYATLRSSADENSRRVRDLETGTLRKEQFDLAMQEMRGRLERIERKVDQSKGR